MDVWNLIIDDSAPGAWNMAMDESLFESVAAERRGPTLRFYRWAPACLSLGVFQKFADWRALRSTERPPDVVRRITGGGAIWHDREWTYSLHLPRSHPLCAGDPNPLYQAVHRAIIAGLAAVGVTSRLRGDNSLAGTSGGSSSTVRPGATGGLSASASAVDLPSLAGKPPVAPNAASLAGKPPVAPNAASLAGKPPVAPIPEQPDPGSLFCFTRGDPNDIVAADGRKLVGSAQRRLETAVLQHGSIVMATPPGSPLATSIEDQTGRPADPEAVLDACRSAMAEHLRVQWRPDRPNDAETGRAELLVTTKHAHPDWLERR